jgi:hypothetical protein
LCVRGTARSFCLGCPFVLRRPEYLDRVDSLLEGYLTAADAHERMGGLAGARERKHLIAGLRQLTSEMLLLAEAGRYGSWTPPWKPAGLRTYREAADAFGQHARSDNRNGAKRGRRSRRRESRGSYDPLQRLNKRQQLVQRIRALEHDLETERQRRAAVACDKQQLRGRYFAWRRRSFS